MLLQFVKIESFDGSITFAKFIISSDSYMWHRGPKIRRLSFLAFFIYTAFASKYFLQYQNILFLSEVILFWLEPGPFL